ncbi:hypothetical protein [Sphingobacterium sp. 1.A.5]|uniref:hypothetical protein n=1 Tax=Sphingobacterium sp. 1.A.5 TaxID=2044604 RepID=UPI000C0BC5A9|nr:hypothetical protein [Sphingobacterium sp. 1.A.5]
MKKIKQILEEYHPLFRKKDYSNDYVRISVWRRSMKLIEYHMYKDAIAILKEYMDNYYDQETSNREIEKLQEYIRSVHVK